MQSYIYVLFSITPRHGIIDCNGTSPETARGIVIACGKLSPLKTGACKE